MGTGGEEKDKIIIKATFTSDGYNNFYTNLTIKAIMIFSSTCFQSGEISRRRSGKGTKHAHGDDITSVVHILLESCEDVPKGQSGVHDLNVGQAESVFADR